MLQAFGNTLLPGDTAFTLDVQGVPLVRQIEGYFDYSAGIEPEETPGLSWPHPIPRMA